MALESRYAQLGVAGSSDSRRWWPFGSDRLTKLAAEAIKLIVIIVVTGYAQYRTSWLVVGDQSARGQIFIRVPERMLESINQRHVGSRMVSSVAAYKKKLSTR